MSKNPTKKPLSYSDKLKDPRWQKKRLRVLERDKWKCQACGDTKTTLHVHHTQYESNMDVWDYPDSMLISLCEDCHKKEHDYLNGSMAEIRELISMAKGDGYLIEDISSLIEIALTVSKNRSNLLRLISDLSKINKSQG